MAEVIATVAATVADFVFNTAEAIGLSYEAAQIVAAIAEVAVSTGLNYAAAEALAPKLPHQDIGRVNLKTTYSSRRGAYGRCRLGGAAFLLWEARTNMYDVIAYCQGPIDGVENIYLNDDLVSLDGSHRVRDTYQDHRYIKSGVGPWIYFNLGHTPETSFYDLGINFDGETFTDLGTGVWTTDHRGDGIVTGLLVCPPVRQADFAGYMPNGQPTLTMSARTTKAYDWRDGTQALGTPSTWKFTTNPIVVEAHYECFNEHGPQHDFSDRIAPSLTAWTAAADVCDELVEQANVFASLTAEAVIGATHVDVPDTTGITVTDTVWLGEPGVPVTVTGLTSTRITFAGDALQEIHQAGSPVHWIVTTGTVQAKRYELGGFFEYVNAPSDVRARILECCDGWMTEAGDGSLTILAGKYYAPTTTIDATLGHVVGYSYRRFTPDEEAVNELQITYTLPAAGFAEADGGSWFDTVDIGVRGETKTQPLKLGWVQNLSQARRLTKRKMARFAAQLTGEVTVNLFGLNCLGQRWLGLNIPEIGCLTNIIVEVIGKPEIDLANMTVKFQWVLADATVDSWTPATDEGGAAALRAPTPVILTPTLSLGGVSDSSLSTFSAGALNLAGRFNFDDGFID